MVAMSRSPSEAGGGTVGPDATGVAAEVGDGAAPEGEADTVAGAEAVGPGDVLAGAVPAGDGDGLAVPHPASPSASMMRNPARTDDRDAMPDTGVMPGSDTRARTGEIDRARSGRRRARDRAQADGSEGGWLAVAGLPSGGGTLRARLEARIRAGVASGRLAPGEALPGSRTLARELGVARITVATAYEQLIAEGYLEAAARRRTRVAAGLPDTGFAGSHVEQAAVEADLPVPNAWAPSRPVTMEDPVPDIPLDLGPEGFALSVLDARAWERQLVAAWRELSEEPTGGAVSYFGGLGDPVLRSALAGYLTVQRGVRARPDQVAITAGAAAAISAVARTWLGPGRRCVIEDPGGEQLRRGLASSGAELIPVPVDGNGLDPARLPRRADVAFVTPSWQYPSGGRLPLARRLALLEWARRARCVIVEDDCEGELRYDGDPLPTLHGLGERGRVLYLNTFSKVLFPGLRTGYLVVPDVHRGRLLAALEAGARPPGATEQRALGRFIQRGSFVRHLRRLRAALAARRAAFAEEVALAADGALEIRAGEAGGHLIVDVRRPGLTAGDVVRRAAELGVRVEPLDANRMGGVDDADGGAVVVYLTRVDEGAAREAARRLARAARGG